MKCPRCKAPAPKASWYCASCGAPLGEINLAYTVAGPARRRKGRLWLGLAGIALAGSIAAVALVNGGFFGTFKPLLSGSGSQIAAVVLGRGAEAGPPGSGGADAAVIGGSGSSSDEGEGGAGLGAEGTEGSAGLISGDANGDVAGSAAADGAVDQGRSPAGTADGAAGASDVAAGAGDGTGAAGSGKRGAGSASAGASRVAGSAGATDNDGNGARETADGTVAGAEGGGATSDATPTGNAPAGTGAAPPSANPGGIASQAPRSGGPSSGNAARGTPGVLPGPNLTAGPSQEPDATPRPPAPPVAPGLPPEGSAPPTAAPRPTGARSGGPTELPPADAALTPTAAAGRIRPGAPVWVAVAVSRPPTIDGWLDDWTTIPFDIASLIFGGEYWQGPADLSATGFAAWDARNLYIAARVYDDVISQPSRGSELYLGDSLEVQLDTNLEADWDESTYSADDWQIGLSPGNLADVHPEAWIWRPAGRAADGIRVAAHRADQGYTVEAAIPWNLLGVDPARAGRMGMAFNVSDNDLAEPAQLTMLSSAPRRQWGDPRSFGTLLLKK